MSQLVAVRSSDLRTVVADVPLKVARGMVDRREAVWTGTSRSIRLLHCHEDERRYSPRGLATGLSAKVGARDLARRYVEAKNSGQDQAVIDAIDGWAPSKGAQ